MDGRKLPSFQPQFEFGSGLSYTTFEYSDLRAFPAMEPKGSVGVSLNVKNTGTRAGKETVIANLPEGNLADAHEQTIAHGIRHVLCVPLLLVRYVDQPGAPIESRPPGRLVIAAICRRRALAAAPPAPRTCSAPRRRSLPSRRRRRPPSGSTRSRRDMCRGRCRGACPGRPRTARPCRPPGPG